VSRKKKKKPAATITRRQAPTIDTEERSSVAITVAWMLATMACFLAGILWLGSQLAILNLARNQIPGAVLVIPDMMRLTAVCTGLLGLTLLPFVLRVRQAPPPRAVTIFSVIVCVLPLLATLARLVVPQ
jgi:hypothetical protein